MGRYPIYWVSRNILPPVRGNISCRTNFIVYIQEEGQRGRWEVSGAYGSEYLHCSHGCCGTIVRRCVVLRKKREYCMAHEKRREIVMGVRSLVVLMEVKCEER